jgi:hypothetical protein
MLRNILLVICMGLFVSHNIQSGFLGFEGKTEEAMREFLKSGRIPILSKETEEKAVEICEKFLSDISKRLDQIDEKARTALFENWVKSNTNWEHTTQELNHFNREMHTFNEHCKKSILLKQNSTSVIKACAFAVLGCATSCLGLKILYDTFKNIQEKIHTPENAKRSWRKIVSTSDYLCILAGITTLGCGIRMIEQCDK